MPFWKIPVVISYALPTPVTTKCNQIQSFHSVYWLSYCSSNFRLRLKELRVNCSSASLCPRFGQDRVNFHQNPGRGTAAWADPTWPNRAGYSIPWAAMLGSGGGGRHGGKSLAARELVAPVWSGRTALWVVQFVLCFLLICIVVVTVPFVCCSVKLPLSQPTSFCLFLSILRLCLDLTSYGSHLSHSKKLRRKHE